MDWNIREDRSGRTGEEEGEKEKENERKRGLICEYLRRRRWKEEVE